MLYFFLFFKQKSAYEMRISDWSSDVCSSDLHGCLSHARLLRQAQLEMGLDRHRRFVRPGNRSGRDRLGFRPRRLIDRGSKNAAVPNSEICRGAAVIRVHASHSRWMLGRNRDVSLVLRSEEHTSELQSLMRISYAVFC